MFIAHIWVVQLNAFSKESSAKCQFTSDTVFHTANSIALDADHHINDKF